MGSTGLAWAVAASLCLYAGGLLINDLVDREVDQHERPDRPLPAGLVSAPVVRWVAMKCFALALLFSFLAGPRALIVAAALGATILLYNFKTKQFVGWGAISMGACRGLNVLLGAAALGSGSGRVLLGAGVIALYVAALTHAARDEAKPRSADLGVWLPLAAGSVGLMAVAWNGNPGSLQAWAGFGGAALLALGPALTYATKPALLGPRGIGMLVGALLLFQASLCMSVGATTLGIVLLLLWPLFHVLARTYPPS